MRYIREFQTGTGSDPRDKWIAVYKCDACGREEWLHMTDRFSFNKGPRPCPTCKVAEPENLAKLLGRKASLETEQARIREELEHINEQLRTYDSQRYSHQRVENPELLA